MSREIKVQFEIRSALIMRDTLEQMGINYEELQKDVFSIHERYHNTVIDCENNTIKYDDMAKKNVDKVKQNYMVNWYKDKAIREGNQIKEEVTADGEILLHVYRS